MFTFGGLFASARAGAGGGDAEVAAKASAEGGRGGEAGAALARGLAQIGFGAVVVFVQCGGADL